MERVKRDWLTCQINEEGLIYTVIPITKAETEVIRSLFPRVSIVRTMRQKSKRHKYYCEEDRAAMACLEMMRSGAAKTIDEVVTSPCS